MCRESIKKTKEKSAYFLFKNRGPLFVVTDTLIIFISFLLAYYLRSELPAYFHTFPELSSQGDYIKGGVLLSTIWIFLIWNDGGYQNSIWEGYLVGLGFRSVLLSGLYSIIALMAISFLYREMLLSRIVYVLSGLLAAMLLILARTIFFLWVRSFSRRGIDFQSVAIIFNNDVSSYRIKRIVEQFRMSKVVGIIKLENYKMLNNINNIPVLGDLAEFMNIYEKNPFNTLIIPSTGTSMDKTEKYSAMVVEVINFCEAQNISLYMLSDSYDVIVSRHEVGSFSGIPLIRLRDASMHPVYSKIKRLFDYTISIIILLGGMPLWLLIAIIIKLDSSGPVFFKQIRVGLYGATFSMYKFRTMVENAEAELGKLIDIEKLEEPVFKIKNDPRVTSIGKILRRTSFDELPQLLNVLKGDMSLVGPRPEELKIVERYNSFQRRRLKAIPGITGLQQVESRGDSLLSERIKYDLVYLKYQSFLLDFYILFKTTWVVISGKGVTH